MNIHLYGNTSQLNPNMQISVSSDFTKYPGARFKTDGNFSGEQFYEDLLLKKYEEALSKNERLIVSFDGVS